MIVDVFMFDDEFDMLDCRLYQLRGLVDFFVAIEANQSVSGIAKPYHLTENLNRYPDAPIEIVRVDLANADLNTAPWDWGNNPDWQRDAIQRDGAMDLLNQLPGDTAVITGDLDEIPRREAVMGYAGYPIVLMMPNLAYSLKWQHVTNWYGPVIAPRSYIRSLNHVRHSGIRRSIQQIPNAGWHLSYFGTPEDRVRKVKHFAHQELVHLAEKTGEELPRNHLHIDGSMLLPFDGDWPEWVKDGHAPSHWTKEWEES